MFKKKNIIMDERIQKESNRLVSKQFYVIMAFAIISLVVKLVCQLPFYIFLLECIAIVVPVAYVILKEAPQGIIFMKNKDEVIRSIHEDVLAKAFNLCLWIVIIGELLFWFGTMAFAKEYIAWIISYFAIWLPSSLWVTIASIEGGLLIWGSKKKEIEGKKNFALRTAISALAFGVIMTVFKAVETGTFHTIDILYALLMALGWGIPFYIMFMLVMKVAEKSADKIVEDKTNEE